METKSECRDEWSPLLKTGDYQCSLYSDGTFEVRDGSEICLQMTAKETDALLEWIDSRPVAGELYAVLFEAKEALAFNGAVITSEGKNHWVTIDPDGCVAASSTQGKRSEPPRNIKTWETVEHATAFMAVWQGHPWYAIPKTWEVVGVVAINKTVFSHYLSTND